MMMMMMMTMMMMIGEAKYCTNALIRFQVLDISLKQHV